MCLLLGLVLLILVVLLIAVVLLAVIIGLGLWIAKKIVKKLIRLFDRAVKEGDGNPVKN